MTALQPHPRPENPEKGENPRAGRGAAGFSPYLPFSGPRTAQNVAQSGATIALAVVRPHSRTPQVKSPGAPRREPAATR